MSKSLFATGGALSAFALALILPVIPLAAQGLIDRPQYQVENRVIPQARLFERGAEQPARAPPRARASRFSGPTLVRGAQRAQRAERPQRSPRAANQPPGANPALSGSIVAVKFGPNASAPRMRTAHGASTIAAKCVPGRLIDAARSAPNRQTTAALFAPTGSSRRGRDVAAARVDRRSEARAGPHREPRRYSRRAASRTVVISARAASRTVVISARAASRTVVIAGVFGWNSAGTSAPSGSTGVATGVQTARDNWRGDRGNNFRADRRESAPRPAQLAAQ